MTNEDNIDMKLSYATRSAPTSQLKSMLASAKSYLQWPQQAYLQPRVLLTCIITALLLNSHNALSDTKAQTANTLSQTLNHNTQSLSLPNTGLSAQADEISSNPFDSFSTGEEFLTVDEAYQLSLRQNKTHIFAEWVIAEHHFLYDEKFGVKADNHPLSIILTEGQVSYDKVFEKDVEKHYVFAKATINKADILALNKESKTAKLAVRFQGCADAGLCYPPKTQYFNINVGNNHIAPAISGKPLTADSSTSVETPSITNNTTNSDYSPAILFIIMLFSALLGGMFLNLMPCVFPVLSIKALSLANSHDKSERIKHGWSYTLGCLITFITVASILLIIRDAGKAVGWGFQLQSPAVVSFLALLFFIMGLSLSGIITFSGRWMNTGQTLTQGRGTVSSFFTGVLAAIVASPCTAPLMAPALGYALTQSTPAALGVFSALGFGMALPFLLLSYLPKLGEYLPKPGAWMETFKQALAFPLYLTSIWLIWIVGNQAGSNSIIMIALGIFTITFGIWLNQKLPRWSTIIVIIVLTILAVIIHSNRHTQESSPTHSEHSLWETYSDQKLQSLREQGIPVFVNLTADWCITCKVNEKLVFTDDTLQRMKDQGIVLLEGDWTNYNAEITQLLDQYGRGGVPLYLLYPRKVSADAHILPQLLNPSRFNDRLLGI